MIACQTRACLFACLLECTAHVWLHHLVITMVTIALFQASLLILSVVSRETINYKQWHQHCHAFALVHEGPVLTASQGTMPRSPSSKSMSIYM